MSKIRSTTVANLLLVAGLMILAMMLAACGTDSEAAAAPVGLRAEAIDDLVAQAAAGDEIVETALDAPADAITELTSETEAGLTTTVTTAGNGQARVADRSQHTVDPETLAAPSPAEIAGLIFMREEEKLARDVYLALYDIWGQPIFQNISGSEQAHMDAILTLLEQYGIADPAAGKTPGEFSDPYFASLYEDLTSQGSLSLIEALRVGAAIEELDIVDLQDHLKETSNEFIVQVYSNLLAGSENHLRAFVSNLERQGGVYEPVTLEPDAYQAIIDGSSGNGGYRGGNDSSGGGNGNGNGRRNGRNNA